mgnify:CR=1 FL=1
MNKELKEFREERDAIISEIGNFDEEDFRDLISCSKGFCLKDYAQLVLNSKYASLKMNEYVKAQVIQEVTFY